MTTPSSSPSNETNPRTSLSPRLVPSFSPFLRPRLLPPYVTYIGPITTAEIPFAFSTSPPNQFVIASPFGGEDYRVEKAELDQLQCCKPLLRKHLDSKLKLMNAGGHDNCYEVVKQCKAHDHVESWVGTEHERSAKSEAYKEGDFYQEGFN
ncbi:hypothetical protein COLO4_35996 [Corchorus olitorius]|uniref:Uncharacterized protein n=1 Tax=Corchorus olitorius TaxID=93759 RepID=A0A1R3GBI8_9ROSI|nr:hypothetical protein COLO4_35996 [Corchorus olitorius]